MIKKIFMSVAMVIFLISCSDLNFGDFTQSFFGEKLTNLTEEEKFERKMRNYKLEAIMKTTRGDIKIILYPDAAPLNTAHFVYLAVNGFYDNMPFHRVIPSVLVQTGDENGDGTGTSGAYVKDEFVNWLDFSAAGMLGMANISEPNTNGGQIFITLAPIANLNNLHTIIGELSSKDDLSIARLIRSEDKVLGITIKGNNVEDFLSNFDTSDWKNFKK